MWCQERIKNSDQWVDYVKRWRMRPDPTERGNITKMVGAVLFKTLFGIDLTDAQTDLCTLLYCALVTGLESGLQRPLSVVCGTDVPSQAHD